MNPTGLLLQITSMSTLHIIGEVLASKITDPVGKSHTDYLHSPCESRLNFTTVNENVVAKIIESMKTKSSCGDDGLSTKLLQEIKKMKYAAPLL